MDHIAGTKQQLIRSWKGTRNAVELNGIDDSVLGVHLDSKQGTVWYRKDGELVAG
jgi:hypothetical protein